MTQLLGVLTEQVAVWSCALSVFK
uniref:Uncharacterized protein n=1 Tax=Strigamia maritima TaxID=126957 RepID=T1JHF3_STRMM